MPLILVTGRANTGKTGETYAALREALREGRRAELIVPNKADLVRARRELGAEFPVGLRVNTFDGHMAGLWATLGDQRRIISPAQRALLVSQAVAEDGLIQPGLPSFVTDIVRRLAEATGSEWRQCAGKDALSRLVQKYAQATHSRGYIEPAEIPDLLAALSVVPESTLVLNRFSDLTQAQRRFVRFAHEVGSTVVVALTWDPKLPATDTLAETVASLSRMGVHRHMDGASASDEIGSLAERLFCDKEPIIPSGAVAFLEAPDPETEAERIAMYCRETVDSGISPENIAVVHRSPAGFAERVADALASAGLPSDVDRSSPVTDTRLGSALVASIRFVLFGERADLLQFLQGPYSGFSQVTVSRLEHRWRERETFDIGVMLDDLRELGGGSVSTLEAVRAADRAGSPEDWSRLLHGMFRLAWESPGVPIPAAERDAAALSALVAFLEDATAMPDLSLDARLLWMALSSLRIAPRQVERQGAVQIMDAERARGRRFDTVILAGLSAGEFPSVVEDPSTIRAARRLFADAGAEDVSREGSSRERMLLYELVSRPRRRLMLTRSSTSQSGEPVAPSLFWCELMSCFNRSNEDDNTVPAELLPIGANRLPRRAAADLLVAHARAGSPSSCSLPEDVGAIEPHVLPERIVQEAALARLAAQEAFSPSAIERYLACPRSWFLERYMRPEEVDRELDGRMHGRVAHDALAEFYSTLFEQTGRRRIQPGDEPTVRPRAESSVDTAIEKGVRTGGIPAHWARRLRRPAVERVVRRVLADTTCLEHYEPTHLEWDFSSSGPVDVGGVLLKGRIDRVDQNHRGGAVVIDYKLSGGVGAARWESDGLVQLPLYMAVVREVLGVRPTAGLYATLGAAKGASLRGAYNSDAVEGGVSSSAKGDAMSGEELDDLIASGLDRAREAVEGMRSGRIEMRAGSACERCGFAHLCGEGV